MHDETIDVHDESIDVRDEDIDVRDESIDVHDEDIWRAWWECTEKEMDTTRHVLFSFIFPCLDIGGGVVLKTSLKLTAPSRN